jgi:glutathione synthase/RimK-type ligase-like ATP-grasp enzyme
MIDGGPGVGKRPLVALATSVDWPRLLPDERGLEPALRHLGIDAEIAIWTDVTVDWNRFDAIVIRSCWDYHEDLGAWLAWLDRLEREGAGARMHNPPSLLRWNARKTYLTVLAARGVPIVPTVWLDSAALSSAAAVRQALRAALGTAPELVAKPAVSAGARGTLRLRGSELEGDSVGRQLDDVLPSWRLRGPVLVQPFLAEIAAHGEWSLLFFNGHFSHAVLKRPAAGDFRVQPQHGGTTEARQPPPALRAAAEEVLRVAFSLAQAQAPALYARVDLVLVAGTPLLMELEVIEPALFLQHTPAGAGPERFARAIAARLSPE